MNRFELIAEIAEREILRYTPAGVPIISATLLHNSTQIEAETKRLVRFEVPVIAAGEISGRFNQAELGTLYQFTGFITNKGSNSKRLIYHIIDFQPLQIEN